MIKLICHGCGEAFQRKASIHKANIKRGRKIIACSPSCSSKAYRVNKTRICKFCDAVFEYKNPEQAYCSRTCSNQAQIKIERVKSCKRCGKEFKTRKSGALFCSISCGNLNRRTGEDYSVTTIGDLKKRFSSPQLHSKIRGNARIVFSRSGRPKECVCGYNLHVDICHIRPVSDFPDETPISEINDINNLVALDKRCHWELDHGYLKL